MKCLYQVIESCFLSDNRQCEYGIAATVTEDECIVVLASVHHLCKDLHAITQFVRLCNELELDPIHLPDAVDDFLASL